MLFDSNFLVDEAQVIKLKDGRYVTLTEAIGIAAEQSDSGLDPEVLKRAVRTATNVHQASCLSEGRLLSKALTSFQFAVTETNASATTPKTFDEASLNQGKVIYCPELSMNIKTLTPELWKEFGLYTGIQGAVIVSIDANAPPGHHNLKPGMVINSWFDTYIPNADTLVSKAKEMVSAPAVVRGSGRDQVMIGFWKWNGTLWERDYVVIWVVGKKASNLIPWQTSDDEIASNLTDGKSIDLGNGVHMEFVLIPAGSFYMGSPLSETGRYGNESPVRRVQITRPFYMGKYEVTQDQYMAVMGKNPSKFSGRNLPVELVSWDEAVAFCKKVGGRLPTEAEWEYACRTGTDTRFYFGNSDSDLKDHAWYSDNSGERTHAIGQKKPNVWGLYDMHGNVWEWCQDWFADDYQNASSVDPKGPSSGNKRVLRGGSWLEPAWHCRSAGRGRNAPGHRYFDYGFRVVLENEMSSAEVESASPDYQQALKTDSVFELPFAIAPFNAAQAKEYQLRTSRYYGIPASEMVDLINGVTMEFVLIPAGEFSMGSPIDEKDRRDVEGPIHRVRISKPFYMGRFEVTEEQYIAIMGKKMAFWKGGDIPVRNVSWKDASNFCSELSDRKSRIFRLPTEAEWEFACRAGTQTRFFYGNDLGYSRLGEFAWYSNNTEYGPKSVGQRLANSFGLHDMHGKVWEWCSDWYDKDYYQVSPAIDPLGPYVASRRVCRGGGIHHDAPFCRSAVRWGAEPDYYDVIGGFRVLLETDTETKSNNKSSWSE